MSKAKSNPSVSDQRASVSVLEFDGIESYATLGSAGALHLAERSFTVDVWAKINPGHNGTLTVLGTDDSRPDHGLHLCVRDMKPYFGFYANDTAGVTKLAPDAWAHLAWRFDSKTGEQSIFVNGILDNSSDRHAPFKGAGPVNVGRCGGGNLFSGQLSELRIWNHPLATIDIPKLVHARVDGPREDLVACWPFDDGKGETARNLASGHPITVNGRMQIVTAVLRTETARGTEHMATAVSLLSGRDDGFRVPWSSELDFSRRDDFTVEAIFSVRSDSPAKICIVGVEPGTGPVPFLIQTVRTEKSIELQCFREVLDKPVFAVPLPEDDNLHHVAFGKAGGTLVLFLDGRPVEKAPDQATGRLNNRADLIVGTVLASKSEQSIRQVGELRIWNHFRDPEAVAEFCQRPLTGNEIGLCGYWPLNESGDAAGTDGIPRPTAKLHNSAWSRSAVPSVPGKDEATTLVMQFPGDGSHIAFGPETRGINFPKGFAIEAWVFPSGEKRRIYERPIVCSHGPGNGSSLRCSLDTAEFMVTTDRQHRHATAPVPTGQWVHLAGVFHDHRVSLYVNGVLRAEVDAPGELTPGHDELRIGQNLSMPDRSFAGQAAEIRLWGRPRSGPEIINDLFQRLDPRSQKGLAGYWPLDAVTEGQVADLAPDGKLNGVLKGVSLVEGQLPPRLPQGTSPRLPAREPTAEEAALLKEKRRLEEEILSLKKVALESEAVIDRQKSLLDQLITERDEFRKARDQLPGQVDRARKLEAEFRRLHEGDGAVSLEFFISRTREQIEKVRKELKGDYRLGDVSMQVQMIPAPDGSAAVFPGKDDLIKLQNSLSTLRLNFEEVAPPELPPQQQLPVPDLARNTETFARQRITEAGFVPEIHYEAITRADSSGTGIDLEGRVVNQLPAPSETAPRGSTVIIFIGRMSG